MKYVRLLPTAPDRFEKGTMLAFGCFDGLHPGHRALLLLGKEYADRLGVPYGAWIPVGAKKEQSRLHDEEMRNRAFAELGVSFLVEEPFEEIKDLSPEDFFARYLLKEHGVIGIACGENFTYGKNAAGTVDTLKKACEEKGVFLTVQPFVYTDEGEVISSTAIRKALSEGNTAKAAALAGRNYRFSGEVAHGRAVGRKMGFPTANLPLPENCPLRYGVYAVSVFLEGKEYPAIANVGKHPTFGKGEKPVCEVYLLKTPENTDFYGREVTVEFLRFVRDEQCFSSPEMLRTKIEEDVKEVKKAFGI